MGETVNILDESDLRPLERFVMELGEGLYSHPARRPDHSLCCVARFLFTTAILSELHPWGYEDRWCYHNEEGAVAALKAWSGEEGTEPEGWHRHPVSGRRRRDGDPAKEEVRA